MAYIVLMSRPVNQLLTHSHGLSCVWPSVRKTTQSNCRAAVGSATIFWSTVRLDLRELDDRRFSSDTMQTQQQARLHIRQCLRHLSQSVTAGFSQRTESVIQNNILRAIFQRHVTQATPAPQAFLRKLKNVAYFSRNATFRKPGAVLAQKFWGGALSPSAPSSLSPFSPFSETGKIRTSYRPTFEICH